MKPLLQTEYSLQTIIKTKLGPTYTPLTCHKEIDSSYPEDIFSISTLMEIM